jgi:hypothetical protein
MAHLLFSAGPATPLLLLLTSSNDTPTRMHLVVGAASAPPLIVLLFLLQRHKLWERILPRCERQMEKGNKMRELGVLE